MLLAKVLSSSIRASVSGKRVIRVSQVRQIHNSLRLNAAESSESSATHRPDKWDKRMLVFMKKYPSIDAVPDTVPSATMDKTRNYVRIRVNLVMCVMTGIICFIIFQFNKHYKVETLHEQWERKHQSEQKSDTSA